MIAGAAKWMREAARPTQIVAGLMLGLAGLWFLAGVPFALVGPIVAPETWSPLAAVAALVFAAAIAVPTLLLAGRLVTGRTRADGGLFPPWVLVLFGLLMAAQGIILVVRRETDLDGLVALLEVSLAALLLVLRRARRRAPAAHAPPEEGTGP